MECVKLRKMAKGLAEVLTRVAILGMSAQVLLGLFWILTHFPTFPKYEESLFLLKVQESLGFDEYTGILYPLLMRLLSMVAGAFSMPFYCLIYVIQLGVAAWAAFYFVAGLGGMKRAAGWFRALIALALLTMPVSLQCHLAVLPYSLAGSFFLMQLGMLLRAVRRGEVADHDGAKAWKGWKRPAWNLVRMGLAWTLQAFLLPEYYLFGGLLLVFYGLWEAFGKREDKEASAKEEAARVFPILLLAAVFLSLIPCVMKMTIAEDSGHGSNLAAATFQNSADKSLKEAVKDAVAYELSPAFHLLALNGKGHYTQLAKNQEIMRWRTPFWTTVFISFGGWCFLGILLLGACLQAATLIRRQGKRRFLAIRELIALFLTGMAMVAYYSLWAGGAMDDKKTYVIALLWVAAAGNAIANNVRFEQKEKKAGE